MAHIVDFIVDGLAGRSEPYAQELDRSINVFFGLNGSGKTSLLKILHSAMTGDASPLRNVPFTRAEVRIYSIEFDSIFIRRCERNALPSESSADRSGAIQGDSPEAVAAAKPAKLEWRMTPEYPKGPKVSWKHLYLTTSRLYWADNISNLPFQPGVQRSKVSEDQLDEHFAALMERLWTS